MERERASRDVQDGIEDTPSRRAGSGRGDEIKIRIEGGKGQRTTNTPASQPGPSCRSGREKETVTLSAYSSQTGVSQSKDNKLGSAIEASSVPTTSPPGREAQSGTQSTRKHLGRAAPIPPLDQHDGINERLRRGLTGISGAGMGVHPSLPGAEHVT